MKIFILDEMRQKKISDFKAAIIEIFDDGRKPKLYIKEQAQFFLTFKNRQLNKKDFHKIITVDLKEIKTIEWDEKILDKNSAKIFIIKWSEACWILGFDFRYNKELALKKKERANEFLNASKKLSLTQDFNVLIYLLWSCAELIIDSKLYLMPGQKPKKTHSDRREKIEKFQKSSVFSNDFIRTFTLLSEEKNPSRYATNAVSINKIDEKFINETISILETEINNLLP